MARSQSHPHLNYGTKDQSAPIILQDPFSQADYQFDITDNCDSGRAAVATRDGCHPSHPHLKHGTND
jgi:hypothetical protein